LVFSAEFKKWQELTLLLQLQPVQAASPKKAKAKTTKSAGAAESQEAIDSSFVGRYAPSRCQGSE